MAYETRRINWNRGFEVFDLNAVSVPSDGNCFFHAFLMGFHIDYIINYKKDTITNRRNMVQTLRQQIAEMLDKPIDPSNSQSKTYYDILSRGTLAEFAAESQIKDFTLEGLRASLMSGGPVGLECVELTSILCNKNIFILNSKTQDAYRMGDAQSLLYKPDRGSVVLLYHPEDNDYTGHYELVALGVNNYQTHLRWDNPFLVFLRSRTSKGIEVRDSQTL